MTTQLPDLPEQMVNVGIDYQYQDRLAARLALNHVASREHIKDREKVELDPYTHVDFSASYRFLTTCWSQWEALFSAKTFSMKTVRKRTAIPCPVRPSSGGCASSSSSQQGVWTAKPG